MSVVEKQVEQETDTFLAVLKARCAWRGISDAELELVRTKGQISKMVATLMVELARDSPSEATARVLERFSQSVENRVVLIGAGAVPAVVQILASADLVAKKHAAFVLQNFSFNDQNEIAIVRAGAVPPLVEMLKSDDVIAGGIAACALRELSYNGQNKMDLVEAGAIPPLIALLSIFSKLDVKAKAAMALNGLGEKHFSNQLIIVAAGAVPPLVCLLEDGPPDHDCRAEAAIALSTLSENKQNQPVIAKSGAISLLVELLSCENPKSQLGAAGALSNVCFDAKSRVAAVFEGALIPLVDLLVHGRPDAKDSAVAAMHSLSLASQNLVPTESGAKLSVGAAVIEAGAVPPLETLLSEGNVRQQELAAKTLRNLNLDSEFFGMLRNA